MTQKSIVVSTTPPLPGLSLVNQVNDALEALGTDFAGPDDPAAFAKPYMTWADTGNLLKKRRNAAGSDWVVEGTLLKESVPKYAEADIPTTDKGDIHVIGKGIYTWGGAAYAPASLKVSSIESAGPIKAAPSTAAGEVVVQSQAFGVGQTRQPTSKTLGSNYTNLSGRPRDVSVLATSTATGQFVRIISVTSGRTLAISRSSAAGQEIPATTTIFNNETYLVEASLAYTSWLETA